MPALTATSPTGAAAPQGVPLGPVVVVINQASGARDKTAAIEAIESVVRASGRTCTIARARRRESVEQLCERAALEVARGGGVLVAAGGDGTVASAANAARRHDVALAVVPLGTFNYFARLHRLPDDPAAAARLLLEGRIARVAAGEVNGRLFLNNASFGLYTRLIHLRERAKARFGRLRIVAALSAAAALLQGQRPFAIRIVDDAAVEAQYTSMVFVACNAFQLEALGLQAATCTRAGALGVVLLRPTGLRDRLRLLLRTALRELDEDHRLQSFCTTGFDVRCRRPMIPMVLDGEVLPMRTPLAFRIVPQAIRLVVPPG